MKLYRFLTGFCIFFLLQTGFCAVKLPRLVSDSMILQRDTKINVWGWAANGEMVTVNFAGKKYKTKADIQGRWAIKMLPIKSGGPYEMEISASNKIILKNILVGDVWFCSGQSNMVHQMELHKERYAEDIAKADYPGIRHFFVPNLTDLQNAQDDLPAGYWKSANPADVRQFSAVAYFFAKTIYDKYHIPIGLINASVGGTPIEAWMSENGFKAFPAITAKIEKNKDTAYINSINRSGLIANANRPQRQQDKGLTGAKTWYDTTYIPKGWQNINIPGYWEDQGVKDLDGVVWYRKEIEVPVSMTGITAKVALGRIVNADMLYVNGVLAGNTTYEYPQRRYNLAAGLLKAGKNIFVIKVINNAGKGGFVPDKPYYLLAGDQTIDLKGEWKYKVGEVYLPQRGFGGGGFSKQNQPTALYNAMVAPLTRYTIKGMLWYQGESNTTNAAEYAKLLPALITDWRQQWQQAEAPFLFVQLPNFMDANYLPAESQWAMLREAQLKALSVSNTGMAVAIDLGEWNDIHPDNKKDVGYRLALAAEKVAYGEKEVVYSGPVYQSATIAGNKISLSFTNIGSGLFANDGEDLSQFAIAGADKKFTWAKAKIDGNSVVVWNENIANPMYVRYAWADNPVGANLYNREGLPASPFRTDQ